jgi:uncharacterized protein YggU (UPF0235/DUF167 family)
MPKSARDAIEGVETGADGRAVLKLRVRAAPQDGKANAAIEALLARALGVAPSRVSVIAGHAARLKRVRVDTGGEAPAALWDLARDVGR